jgi:undecaprenyl-phosphate galactose phosphotransferase
METEVLTVRSSRVIWEVREGLLKRTFDLFFSATLLIILSPLFLAIILSIKILSGGTAIYVQPRLGKGGKLFNCYKFRTMYIDAEDRLHDLLARNPHLQIEWLKNQKLKDDPRIFTLGKWLRRTSLDELPQFWNVLIGDLSVVGPRPYMLSQKKSLGDLAPKILSIRPGITGLWQTSGRNRTTFQERISLDAAYIDTHSFFYDLFLILKTIPCVLFQKDAY